MKNYALKKLRKNKNLSQHELSQILGIKTSTYSNKENGNRKFTLEEAILISDFFKKEIKEIFK